MKGWEGRVARTGRPTHDEEGLADAIHPDGERAIHPEELGVCDIHEHTLLDWSYMLGKSTPDFDHVEASRSILDLLEDFRDAGADRRRRRDDLVRPDPWLHLLLAYGSGMNIIASVGFFNEMDCPMPANLYASSIDELAAWLAAAINDGIGGTGVKAGILKAASSSDRITPAEEKAIRAVARAQLRTGAGIITHVSSPVVESRLGLEQVELFEQEGVDPAKVVVGHMGWDPTPAPLDYHLEVARTGANLGYDQIGDSFHDDEFWVDLIMAMVSHGYADRIFLSHDSVGAWIGQTQVEGQQLNTTYSHVLKSIVPKLKEAGISEADLRTILVDNPTRLLTIAA